MDFSSLSKEELISLLVSLSTPSSIVSEDQAKANACALAEFQKSPINSIDSKKVKRNQIHEKFDMTK